MSWNCGSCVAAILLAQAQSKAQTISCTTSRCTITITRTTPAKKKGWTRRALRRCSPRQHRGRHHRRYPPAWRRTSEAGTPGARAQSHGRLGKLETDCPFCSVLFTVVAMPEIIQQVTQARPASARCEFWLQALGPPTRRHTLRARKRAPWCAQASPQLSSSHWPRSTRHNTVMLRKVGTPFPFPC